MGLLAAPQSAASACPETETASAAATSPSIARDMNPSERRETLYIRYSYAAVRVNVVLNAQMKRAPDFSDAPKCFGNKVIGQYPTACADVAVRWSCISSAMRNASSSAWLALRRGSQWV